MFKCEQCGACCRNVDKSNIYAYLDRGDGTCKYLIGNICSIYNDRPLMCRIDTCYELFFKHAMSKKEYYEKNKKVCKKLKKMEE
jgi:hypothetical protein